MNEFAASLPWPYCDMLFIFYFYREISNIRQFEGFERHIGQERRNNQKHDDEFNPWPCCGNLQHESPDSIFEIRRCHSGGAFATTKSRNAAKNIGDWGRSLKKIRSQVSSPVTDIFHGNPRLDCRENTAEVASLSLKNWAQEPMLKITTLRMIGWGHSNLKLFWLNITSP